jgi:hypothetical protein
VCCYGQVQNIPFLASGPNLCALSFLLESRCSLHSAFKPLTTRVLGDGRGSDARNCFLSSQPPLLPNRRSVLSSKVQAFPISSGVAPKSEVQNYRLASPFTPRCPLLGDSGTPNTSRRYRPLLRLPLSRHRQRAPPRHNSDGGSRAFPSRWRWRSGAVPTGASPPPIRGPRGGAVGGIPPASVLLCG